MASKQGLQSGLDWTDVISLMQAIEHLHSVRLSLVMSLDGAYAPYRVQVVCVAERNAPTGMGVKRSVSRKRFFPCNDAKTLEGLCFRLLHEIDNDCGTFWQQVHFT